VDLSLAVEAAHRNLRGRPGVRILQADLFALPFRPGSFDVIYSLGVLHHTPDCERAFRALVPLLRPGGRLCIWVYEDSGLWKRVASWYRRVTTRLPPRVLYALCRAAGPWYYACRLPVIGRLLFAAWPISMHPRRDWRVLDTFDWYAPRYQSLHSFAEVHGWFRAAGLTEIVQMTHAPVSVAGTRTRATGAVAAPEGR
jgi:SAM-dependent methyltransferase